VTKRCAGSRHGLDTKTSNVTLGVDRFNSGQADNRASAERAKSRWMRVMDRLAAGENVCSKPGAT
jgi:hypothetical protein